MGYPQVLGFHQQKDCMGQTSDEGRQAAAGLSVMTRANATELAACFLRRQKQFLILVD